MNVERTMAWLVSAAVGGLMVGCAGNIGRTTGTASEASTSASTASAKTDENAKAERKISMAIGAEVGSFALTGQKEVDAPTGFIGTEYSVQTAGGETYKCEILEPSGLGKLATWGMASGAAAMCTNFTEASKDRGKTNASSCNALLRAAKKC